MKTITLSHINISTPAFGECIGNNLLDIHIVLLNVLPISIYQLWSTTSGNIGLAAWNTHFRLASYFASTAVNRFRRLLSAFFKQSTADRPSTYQLNLRYKGS